MRHKRQHRRRAESRQELGVVMNAVAKVELSEAETYAAEQCATAALLEFEAQYAEPMKARTGQGPYPLLTDEGE